MAENDQKKRKALLAGIRSSSNEALVERKKQLEEQLFQHRLKRHTNQLENTNLIRHTRREIALVETVLSARRLGKETQGQA
jgi:ribosomal protein L29